MGLRILSTVFKPILNQRGVSLVEGLIGLGAIAGIAAVIATISTNTNDRGFIYRRACESMANNAIDALTDEALFMNVVHFTPSGTKDTITAAEGASLFTINEIANGDLWTGTTQIVDNGARPVVRNEVLIQGAMRALNALYNHGTLDFCSGYQEYAPMSIASLGIQNELTRSNSAVPPILRLRLGVADLSTGATGCPARPFSIVPRSGLTANQRGFETTSYDSRDGANDGIARRGAELSPNHKYVLSAQVEYNHDGQTYTCEVSKDFQYATDGDAPLLSGANITVSVATNTSRLAAFTDYRCQPAPGGPALSASIVINVGAIESGSLLLCRDISEELVYYSSDLALTESDFGPACAPGDGVNLGYRVKPVPAFTNKSYQDTDASQDQWYPCDEARICGGVGPLPGGGTSGASNNPPIAPDSSVVFGANAELTQTPGPITISLTYNDVPRDCVIGLQVVAVDVAGNVSAVVTNQDSVPAGAAYVQDPVSPLATPFYSDADLPLVSGLGAAQDKRIVHRPWCGETLTPTYGTPDEWGVLCTSANTPNWTTTPFGGESTNNITPPGTDPSLRNYTADSNWTNDFPNGYYTCRVGGCCFSNVPGTCFPWSN